MKKQKLILIAVALLLCIGVILFVKNLSPHPNKLIGKTCSITYGLTSSPIGAFGEIKFIDDKWVMVLVKNTHTKPPIYNEVWIPFNKIVSIHKHNF